MKLFVPFLPANLNEPFGFGPLPVRLAENLTELASDSEKLTVAPILTALIDAPELAGRNVGVERASFEICGFVASTTSIVSVASLENAGRTEPASRSAP